MATQKAYKVRLHVISPIHIGCDEVYEPTGFTVDKAAQKLIAFDPVDFVRSLNQKERSKFMALCDKGSLESILEIFKFMDTLQHSLLGHEVEISEGFLKRYKEVVTMPLNKVKQELNKFLISRTSFLPSDNAPYIPGSTLKGSLRTGWLNCLKGTGKQGKVEKDLMEGTFATDPFRMVKISDLVPVTVPHTRICFAVNKKKKISKFEAKGGDIPQMLEVILPESAVFEGIVTLHSQEQGGGINRPIPASLDFFTKATGFFNKEMADEEANLKTINLPAGIGVKMKTVFGEQFMKSVFPVRLGRHSGAECLTIDGIRNIKILGKRVNGKQEFTFAPHSTTVWLAGDSHKAASGLLPFGWAALEVVEADPAHLWTERAVAEKASGVSLQTPVKLPKPPVIVETIVWETAFLTWSPGNATLTANSDGKKVELKLSGDRSIVPAELHKKLFDKKDAVKAKVTLEKSGNNLKIASVAISC